MSDLLIPCKFWAGRFDGAEAECHDLAEQFFPVQGDGAVVKHIYRRERPGYYVFDREETVQS